MDPEFDAAYIVSGDSSTDSEKGKRSATTGVKYVPHYDIDDIPGACDDWDSKTDPLPTITDSHTLTGSVETVAGKKGKKSHVGSVSSSKDSGSSSSQTTIQSGAGLKSAFFVKSVEEQEKTVKKRRQAIDITMRMMYIAEELDLVFLVDCTGSMMPWITRIKDNICTWSERLKANHRHLNLRVAFIGYTDFDQPEASRTTLLDFTTNLDEFKKFVKSITIYSGVGGDSAEDVFGGLETVSKLSWRRDGTKILFHIADNPCHGKEFHNDNVGDDYPNGDPEQRDLKNLIKKIVDREIYYYFGYIIESNTEKMIEAFDQHYQELGKRALKIDTFDASEPPNLDESVYRSISSSISSTLSHMTKIATGSVEPKQRIPKIELFKEVPNWDGIEAKDVREITPDCGSDYKFSTVCKKVKRAQHPFAAGGIRYAYHAHFPGSDEMYVFKESIKSSGRHRCAKRAFEMLQIHDKASAYAKKFNKEKPLNVRVRLNFLTVGVVEYPADLDGKFSYFTYEKFIEGTYQKFNGNDGYEGRDLLDPLNVACQAFSHYSWEASGNTILICDLQGVKTKNGVLLTDPAIHARNVLKHGLTNLGMKGIKLFFEKHKCNHICRQMKLPRFI